MTQFTGTQAQLADKIEDMARRTRIELKTNPARGWAVLAYEASADFVRTAIITESKDA